MILSLCYFVHRDLTVLFSQKEQPRKCIVDIESSNARLLKSAFPMAVSTDHVGRRRRHKAGRKKLDFQEQFNTNCKPFSRHGHVHRAHVG